jgi:flavin-dependent dehydrogenase
VVDQLHATGSIPARYADNKIGPVRAIVEWPTQPGDAGTLMSVRRFVLDPILVNAAGEAGVDVRMQTTVTGLIEEDGRVVGVRTKRAGGIEEEIRARLVVGADGRNSTVARLTGARKYNVVPGEQSLYWGYFENAQIGEPTFVYHKSDDRTVLGCPTDSGLYQVQIFVEPQHLDRFRTEPDAALKEFAMSCEPVAEAIGNATRVERVLGMVRWEGFFRDASGPGWVLVGDSGHFKDPSPGRGMSDAFLQVDRLAPAVASALAGSDADVDAATADFGRWRDEEFAEHYWFACDMGNAGPPPAILVEVVRILEARNEAHRMMEIINHRLKPSELLKPPLLMRGLTNALRRNPGNRREVLREFADRGRDELRRRRLNRRPEYVDDQGAHADAGPTEVEPAAAGT